MSLAQVLFGRPIPDERAEEEKLSEVQAVPVLGLDALASASYGPEAALTVMIPLGAAVSFWAGPIALAVVGLLLLVQASYRQTIAAYPNGGGSYTVARENLGQRAGLVAAAALSLDYVLNVAVALSAGVGAVTSAIPSLGPHRLALCLSLLAVITLVNLRGVRSAGVAFSLPTYLFVAALSLTIVVGLVKAIGGAPIEAPRPLPPAQHAVTAWLLMRTFAAGCTALTGIEAVSNAVPVFRPPRVRRARLTLALIATILSWLVIGIALLVRAYHVGATKPDARDYESVLSQVVSAVMGRGVFYAIAMAAILAVLCLSANTSFAGFPPVARLLAMDGYLPRPFARSGRRLVYTVGVLVLTGLAAALLILFDGVTDRLIPLFAVGAFTAFTLSQFGMVQHWRRGKTLPRRSRGLLINSIGAVATTGSLIVIVAAKFTEGAWASVLFIPACVAGFTAVQGYYRRLDAEVRPVTAMNNAHTEPPVVVVPFRRVDEVAKKGLRFALAISPDVYAVQVLTRDVEEEPAMKRWDALVGGPVRESGHKPPKLVELRSKYREVVNPVVTFVCRLAHRYPGRHVAVVVPELIERRWYHFVLRSHTATALKWALLFRGGSSIVIINAPWYAREPRRKRAPPLCAGEDEPSDSAPAS